MLDRPGGHLGVQACPSLSLVDRPSVDALGLPYIWADLGRRFHRSVYFSRAGEAAEAIKDEALAAWAKRKAADLPVNDLPLLGA
jgi:hypothetical protein